MLKVRKGGERIREGVKDIISRKKTREKEERERERERKRVGQIWKYIIKKMREQNTKQSNR